MPSMVSARSDEALTLDVRQVCRGIASQSADPLATGLQASFEECVKSEQGVRGQLKQQWPIFSTADKQHCVTLAKTGGESSYTELLTCLEMARDGPRQVHRRLRGEPHFNIAYHLLAKLFHWLLWLSPAMNINAQIEPPLVIRSGLIGPALAQDAEGGYLDAVSVAVMEMGGKVAKKLGDGLMALRYEPLTASPDLTPPTMPSVRA